MTDRMTTQEIVKADCERYGFDFEQFYVGMYAALQSGKWRIMRYGNTLLLYELLEPHVAEVHLITADTIPKLVIAIKEFYKAMHAAGFVKTVSTAKDRQIEMLLRRAKIKFTATPTQEMIDGKMVSGYNIVAEA